MSSSNLLLLSSLLFASCVGVEPSELARSDPQPQRRPGRQPLSADAERLREIAREISQREAYLEAERGGPLSIATAVLRSDQGGPSPAIGMAVVEVNAGGLGLRVAAELVQGTHHVYVLGDAMDCSAVDVRAQKLGGSPDPSREEYLGALVNVRDGHARFQRRLPDGAISYQRILGRPLLLVHSKGESVVCGVFRESDEDRSGEVVSKR